jgi:hypothetical protein
VYYHSFAGNPEMRQGWELIGPDAASYVRFEPEGLRITLPLGEPRANANVGLSTFVNIHGDFEITVRYEILKEPAPEESPRQTRFTVYVPLVGKGPSGPNRATFSYKFTNAAGGEYFPWLLLGEPGARKDQIRTEGEVFPARTKAGRLRLTRTGDQIAYWVAEDGDKDFRRLHETAFSAEDIKNIGLFVALGGPMATMDVRVIDLLVRADALANVPTSIATPPRWRVWQVVMGLATLATVMLIAAWRLRRARRGRSPLPDVTA